MVRLGLFVSFFLIAATAFSFNPPCTERTCIGVVDVGSTGSRLHVYQFQNKPDHASEQLFDKVWFKKITPGFATLPADPALINHYLSQLFQDSPEHFPVYFYASAGMRLLPSERQDKYYQAVQAWFLSSAWHLEEARTLTGHEEGLFAWLSVREHLRQATGVEPPSNLSVMDMGGASVQVITAVDTSQGTIPSDNNADYIQIHLNGKPQTLFVHSFLGLGQTLVANQFLDEASCFSEGYRLSSGAVGTGDAQHCAGQIFKLIDDIHDVTHVLQSALNSDSPRTWYVISGLAYLMREAPFSQNQDNNQNKNELTNDALIEQAENTVCRRPWEVVQQDYPEEENLSRTCLTASYYHALIKSYGIAPREPIHLIAEPSEMDWTLGVALHKG
jgi:hypothetical protein